MSDQWDAEYGELRTYIDNDYELHKQRQAIEANLKRKIKRGVYDPKKAPKLWAYMVDAGARKYCKEFGCDVKRTFPKQAVRQPLSEEYARDWEEEEKLQSNPRSPRGGPAMTKTQAWSEFKAMVLPAIRQEEILDADGRIDKPKRRQAWNDYVDSLHRDGLITEHQASTWTHPAGLMTAEAWRSNPKHTRPQKPHKKKRKTGRPKSPYSRERHGGGRRKNPGKKISVRSLVAQALK